MRLIIVRHGDPDYSIDSLTEKGKREVVLLADRLAKEEITDFYCSPLGRARDTAAPTLKRMGRTAEICDWLEEFPGKRVNPETGEEIHAWDMMPAEWTAHPEFYAPGDWLREPSVAAGTVEKMYRRVADGIDGLLARYGYVHDGKFFRVEKESRDTVVLFCHFGVEMVILGHIWGVSPVPLWHMFTALPSSVTTVYTEERQQGVAYFRCCGFGDLSHLYAGNEPPAFAARFCETFSNQEERH